LLVELKQPRTLIINLNNMTMPVIKDKTTEWWYMFLVTYNLKDMAS